MKMGIYGAFVENALPSKTNSPDGRMDALLAALYSLSRGSAFQTIGRAFSMKAPTIRKWHGLPARERSGFRRQDADVTFPSGSSD
jgi:hypothetical protein